MAAASSCMMPPRKFRAPAAPGCSCALQRNRSPLRRRSNRNKRSCDKGQGRATQMGSDILIVDDEADIRELVAGILQDEGHGTRTAADADEAIAAVVARRPNLVFLDIWLQGSRLDGLQLLDALKQDHPELPVVMISGHGNIETAVSAI